MPISPLDGILLVVMLISAVLAMIRGFVREVLSIASWVIAAIAALTLYGYVQPFAKQYISNDMVALAASGAAVFLVTLVIVSYITMRISDFVLDSRIGALDRSLGFVFGAARGLLLMVVAMLFFTWLIPVDRQPDWIAGAKSRPLLLSLGDELISALPDDPEQTLMEEINAARTSTSQKDTAGTSGKADDQPNTGYSASERQGLDQLTTSGSGN